MDHKHSKSPNELSYEHPGQSMSVEQPAEFPRQSMPMVRADEHAGQSMSVEQPAEFPLQSMSMVLADEHPGQSMSVEQLAEFRRQSMSMVRADEHPGQSMSVEQPAKFPRQSMPMVLPGNNNSDNNSCRQFPLVDSESDSDCIVRSLADDVNNDIDCDTSQTECPVPKCPVYDYHEDDSCASVLPDNFATGEVERCVTVYSKTAHGKGKKNRQLPCYFCQSFVYQMPRHLQKKHCNEPEVASALADSSGKRLGLKQLGNLGIFRHNTEVLKNSDGVLIVNRAPKNVRSAVEFLPCQFCFLFFVRSELFRHCVRCEMRGENAQMKGHITAGRAILFGSVNDNCHAKLKEYVFPRMRLDTVTDVVMNDRLIQKLGDVLLEKLGQRRALDISARMRELARVLMRLKSDSRTSNSLADFITGEHFDDVIAAVKAEARPYVDENGRQLYKSPAFILKAGSSLLKCARLRVGWALRNNDRVTQREAKDYIRLHVDEFTDKLSSAAHASLRIQGNMLSELPDEEDLRKLRQYQKNRSQEVIAELHHHPDPFLWRELSELTLSRLLIFNARRGSEGAELSVADYEKATSETDPGMTSSFTDVERQLLSR